VPRDRLESRDMLKSRDKLESEDRMDPKDETGARESQLFSLDSLIGLIGAQGNNNHYPSSNLFLSEIQISNDHTWKCIMTNYLTKKFRFGSTTVQDYCRGSGICIFFVLFHRKVFAIKKCY
jgi:hypothetical protein